MAAINTPFINLAGLPWLSHRHFLSPRAGRALLPLPSVAIEGDLVLRIFRKIKAVSEFFVCLCLAAPPHFADSNGHVSLSKGSRASLECEAYGDQPIDIFWRRNGILIKEEDDARLVSGSRPMSHANNRSREGSL